MSIDAGADFGSQARWPEILGPRIKTDYLYRAATPVEKARKFFGANRAHEAGLARQILGTEGFPTVAGIQQRMTTPDGDLSQYAHQFPIIKASLEKAGNAAQLAETPHTNIFTDGPTWIYPNPAQEGSFLVQSYSDRILDEDGFPKTLAMGETDIRTIKGLASETYTYDKLLGIVSEMGYDSPEQVIDEAIQNQLYNHVRNAIGDRRFDKLSGTTLIDLDRMSREERRAVAASVIPKLKARERDALRNPQNQFYFQILANKRISEGDENGTIEARIGLTNQQFTYNPETGRMEIDNSRLTTADHAEVRLELTPDITDNTIHDGLLRLKGNGDREISRILTPAQH